MKKFLLGVIGMFLMTGITFAQQSQKSDVSCSNLYGKNYWHVSAGLNPITLTVPHIKEEFWYDPFEPVSTDMTGISLGFTHGIRMMKTQPFYLEIGAKLLYAHKKEAKAEWKKVGETWEEKKEYFALNIPIVATWQFEVAPKVCIAPYLGLNMRYNIYGKSEWIEYHYEQHSTRDPYTGTYEYSDYYLDYTVTPLVSHKNLGLVKH